MTNKLVWLDSENYYNFLDPQTGFIYDFQITQTMTFDHWLRQLSQKSWVTGEHLLRFRELADLSEVD